MELNKSMLSLEEEMTEIEMDSFEDEKLNAEANYALLDSLVIKEKNKIPHPEISKYSTVDDVSSDAYYDLADKKRRNKNHEEEISRLLGYAFDGSLYIGHCQFEDQDIYIMDHGQHATTRLKRNDGTEVMLLNVDDSFYKDYIGKWRYPRDYQNVVLSRNITLKNRQIKKCRRIC